MHEFDDPTSRPERRFRAPRKNQAVELRLTSRLIADLAAADGDPGRMTPGVRDAWERGVIGNRDLIPRLQAAAAEGKRTLPGTITDHVEAEETLAADGTLEMTVSSWDVGQICWRGHWDGARDTLLNPDDVILEEVHAAAAADPAARASG